MGLLLLLAGVLGLGSGGVKLHRRVRAAGGLNGLALAEAIAGVVAVIGSAAGLSTLRPLAWTAVLVTVCLILVSSAAHVRRAVLQHRRRQESEGERLKTYLQSGITVLLAGALLLTCGEPRSANGGESAVLAADSARVAAMLAADASGLDSLFHRGLTYIHSNGMVDTKESLVGNLTSGRVDYLSVAPESTLARVHGDGAVVSGIVRMEVEAGSTVHRLRSNYTAVYWWESGRWQLVAYQSGAAAAPVDSTTTP